MDLHNAIMNIPCDADVLGLPDKATAYRIGHRDARHAAAELVAAELATLREEKRRLEGEVERLKRNRVRRSPGIVAHEYGYIVIDAATGQYMNGSRQWQDSSYYFDRKADAESALASAIAAREE